MKDVPAKEILRKNLKKARKESNLSQMEAAEKAGISRPLLSAYETGRIIPPKASLEKLAEVYNTNLTQLLEKESMVSFYTNSLMKTQLDVSLKADSEDNSDLKEDFETEIEKRINAVLSKEQTIELNPKVKSKCIPIVSKLYCPEFLYLIQDVETVIETEKDVDFAIHYRHDNMFSTIRKGDILLIKLIFPRRGDSIEDGTFVLTFNNKRQTGDPAEVFAFFYRKPFYIFQSDNTNFKPIVIDEKKYNKELTILGKVVESRRGF